MTNEMEFQAYDRKEATFSTDL